MSFPSGVKSKTRLQTVWMSWWSWEATSTLHFTASSPLFSAEPDEGTVKWGQTASFSYFPKDNTPYFADCEDDLVQWLRQFSRDPQEHRREEAGISCTVSLSSSLRRAVACLDLDLLAEKREMKS